MNINLYSKEDKIGLTIFKLDLIIPTIKFKYGKSPTYYKANNSIETHFEISFPTKVYYFKDCDMFIFDLMIFGCGISISSQWSY